MSFSKKFLKSDIPYFNIANLSIPIPKAKPLDSPMLKLDNLKTLFAALIIAVAIRSLIIQPFYIPSSSMEPTLLVGDRIFVSKYSYGYSKHAFPFSPNVSNNRYFSKIPKLFPFKVTVSNP